MNSTLLMVGIAAAVAMLSAGLSLTPVQQASANVMEDGDGGDTSFSFEQDQSNRCSGFAGCANEGLILFGVE
jgi:predicted lipoprotein with Yx(FWY)xxD motif